MTHLSPRAIEAGADALRHFEQGGKRLNEWASLPNATKKKWTAKVEAVLTALEAEGMVVVPKGAVQFIQWAMREGPWEGCDLDGASVQDKAEELGVIIKTQYDPKIHRPTFVAEPGDDWYVLAPELLQAAQGGDDAGQ